MQRHVAEVVDHRGDDHIAEGCTARHGEEHGLGEKAQQLVLAHALLEKLGLNDALLRLGRNDRATDELDGGVHDGIPPS